MTRQEVSEIALTLDEIILVRQHDKGITNRRIPMRMEFHRIADDVGDLVKTPIAHAKKRMQDASLNRFQSVAEFRNRAIQNEIARILDEMILHQGLELAHRMAP